MPFKIVQLKERGRLVLQIIPENWEQNGILHWPKRNVESLLSDEASCPDNSWTTSNCVVKRTNLISHESAEVVVAAMSDMSDTEGEPEEFCRQKKIPDQTICFNEMANSCINVDYSSAEMVEPVAGTSAMNDIQTDQQYFIVHDTTSKQVELNEIMQKLNLLEQNQNALFNAMQNVENKILQKLSSVSTMFDEFMKRNSKLSVSENTTQFIKITDRKSLDEFEEKLKNIAFQTETKKQLSMFCGKGKGRGYNNAYLLADIVFSRNFLTQCSWAGGSRTEYPKLCFKTYTATINVFFEVINHSDTDFTRRDCEQFLKTIMRHSNTRNKEIKRFAAVKRRPKRAKVDIQPVNIKCVAADAGDGSVDSANLVTDTDNRQANTANNAAGDGNDHQQGIRDKPAIVDN